MFGKNCLEGLQNEMFDFFTQFFAEVDAGVEGLDGEVDGAVDEPQVGQLNLEGLVHGREVNDGVSCDVVLVQSPPD